MALPWALSWVISGCSFGESNIQPGLRATVVNAIPMTKHVGNLQQISLSGDFFPPAVLQQASWAVYLKGKVLPGENIDSGRQLGRKELLRRRSPRERAGEENYKRFICGL